MSAADPLLPHDLPGEADPGRLDAGDDAPERAARRLAAALGRRVALSDLVGELLTPQARLERAGVEIARGAAAVVTALRRPPLGVWRPDPGAALARELADDGLLELSVEVFDGEGEPHTLVLRVSSAGRVTHALIDRPPPEDASSLEGGALPAVDDATLVARLAALPGLPPRERVFVADLQRALSAGQALSPGQRQRVEAALARAAER